MEIKEMNINVPKEGAELIIRQGDAPKVLDPKPPVKTVIKGSLKTPVEFLTKRLGKGQFTEDRCLLLVSREEVKIELVFNENDEYTRGSVTGILSHNPKFLEFGINTGKVWTPSQLGVFLKMNRTFFEDKSENMKLVNELMNFTATVNSKVEKGLKESGSKTDNYEQVVNSNLPSSFKIKIPIFKGYEPETLEIETFAKLDGRDVSFILLSPGANEVLESTRDTAIDEQLDLIKQLAPGIAIIEQ